ncbi:hypothetical protein Sjap_023082 [Stephania japonica]|uniref:GDSL esterase/lipase n=1 Tax=Stephania japonica TaxID=461633 RepID=A0AAP0EQ30_9MAGN
MEDKEMRERVEGNRNSFKGNLLGLGLIPAFQNPKTIGSNILKGVNFASSAAGVLQERGTFLGDRWTFNLQIEQFATNTLPELRSQVLRSKEGNKELSVDEFLAKSLSYSNIGSNDFINYIVRNYKDPEAYIDWVISAHTRQLKVFIDQFQSPQTEKLYQLGGRKFLVFGLAPMGCLPTAILLFNKNAPEECSEQLNQVVQCWNTRLEELLKKLKHKHASEGNMVQLFLPC